MKQNEQRRSGHLGEATKCSLLCGAITAGAGALVLAGWALGSDTLTALGAGYIPMAPNTALLFVLLGCALVAREVWPASRMIHRAVAVAALVSALVGIVTLAGFVTGLNIDEWLFRSTRTVGAVPVGRMALVTALCFILSGVSLFLLEKQVRNRTAILGILVALAGMVRLMGYWFGAPLFYGGPLIPVALPTSLAFVTLGVALLAAARPDPWPVNALIVASALAVFAMDWLTPLGHADWLLYLIPLLLTTWTRQCRSPVVMAAICSVLMVAGFFLSPPGLDPKSATFNRGLGVAVLWIAAALLARRGRAEAMLRASEEEFHSLAEAMPQIVWVCRPDGGNIYFNQQWVEYTGLTLEESYGHGWNKPFHPDDQQRAWDAWQNATQNNADYSLECSLRRADGAYRWWLIRGVPLRDASGQILKWFGTCTDIEEIKQAEAALRHLTHRLLHAEDSERRRIAKELHDSTAQDLVAVMMSLDSVRARLAGRAVQEAEQLEDSLAVLEKCAHDIRTLSYLLHPPRLDEAGLAGALRHYADGFGERSGIAMTLELPEDLGRLDEDVELVLFRVVQECLGNIHRHARSPTTAIRICREASALVMEVRDVGCGMPPAVLAAARGSGTGLGVGIPGMSERLRQIGGRLEIESGGQGTTIRVIVPRPQEPT